jgi:isopentenyl diphosphate isomerase/L-lactate dehydrogenase-like FMN-dependent dehydrogenase
MLTWAVLAEEIATAMRLLGVSKVDELGPQHVRRIHVEDLVSYAVANVE